MHSRPPHRATTAAVLAVFCLAWAVNAQTRAEDASPAKLVVTVLDESQLPVSGAQVEIKVEDQLILAATTNETGRAEFSCIPGRYRISAFKEGFEAALAADFEYRRGIAQTLELMLKPAVSKESVEVHDTVSPVEAGEAPTAAVRGESVRELPSQPSTVNDALPMIPGIARQPSGQLQLSGGGEHRSTMLVNSADVTDPATGGFGLTVPIDSVESINFYQASFLAEYGRYSAGLVSVETRRGGDERKWELNDPLPEFNIRSWHLRGLRTTTPRLNFEGALIPGKLYYSEGFEYVVRKTPVFTLPFPYNQKKEEGFNSFSQFDWIASAENLVTATIHAAPQRLGFVNLNYFNPQSTTPDASTHDYTGAISDKWSVWGGLWENISSVTRFDAAVWPKETVDFVIAPQFDSGSYFARQNRDARRYGWSSSFEFGQWKRWGVHTFKAGLYVAKTSDRGQIFEHPIDIQDESHHLLENIAFTGGAPYRNTDTELALFEQDHWVLHPRISLDLGFRLEHQAISESLRVAPRGGINWNPFRRLGTVIRAGVGMFYDRVPLGVYSFAQYPERVLTFYDGNGAITAGPITYSNALGEMVSHRRFIFTRDEPGNFSPRSTTGSVHVDQPVTRNMDLRVGYLQTVSSGLVILDSTAPNPATQTATTLLSGNGTAHYRQFDITSRVRAGAKRELFFSFVRSRATGDLNDFAGYIGSFPNAIIHSNQVTTLPTDLPNRFLAWGSLQFPVGFGLAPVFEYRNGFPYSTVNAQQRYAGVPNSQRFPNFLSADARVWRDFKVTSTYSVRLSVSGFNLTNHFNPEANHWNTADPAYGLFFGERHRRFTVDFDVLF
jgi:hypothetical protein